MKKLLLTLLFLSACVSLSESERATLYELEQYGAPIPVRTVANPKTAAFLNVLPGVGNFYLACGEGGELIQLPIGIIHLLTWPFSPLWSVAQAYKDANSLNKKETVLYYRQTPQGRAELKKLQQNASF